MTTPYTLIRCRMKDLISCFSVCKVTMKEDRDESDDEKPKTSSIDDDRKRQREKQVELGTTAEKGGGEESPTSWKSCESEEDEYIVFYFKDDDTGVEVVEERGLDSSLWRKQGAVGANHQKKHDERIKIQVDHKFPLETEEVNESEEDKNALGESSNSSTSSFAFPTIQKEWTGSPVLMPKPEGHNKSKSVCIQCCKF